MQSAFLILGLLTLLSAAAAMTLRNLVHCALCAAVSFIGLAGLFLLLNAEFIAFAQVLVYVGAVAILLVMAILLTGNSQAGRDSLWSPPAVIGIGVAALVCGSLLTAIVSSPFSRLPASPPPSATVRQIGEQLMTQYVLPLEVLGVLLTAALIGAVLLALRNPEGGPRP